MQPAVRRARLGHDTLAYDPRWAYGVPARPESALAWVQHALAHLTPGGHAALLLPPATAGRASERRVRAELVRSGALRAVIALPAGASVPLHVGLQVWVLQRPEPGGPARESVLFVDTAADVAGPVATAGCAGTVPSAGLLSQWKQREEDAAGIERPEGALPVTPRAGLRALRRPYFAARSYFTMDEERAATGDDAVTYAAPEWRDRVRTLNAEVLRALGYDAKPGTLTVVRAEQSYEVTVAHAEKDLVALDCGWSPEPDDALAPDGAGRLLDEVRLDGQHTITTGSKLASFLFACEDAPRYVLLLVGGVVLLADRAAWGEGRYLAVSLDRVLERNGTKAGGELDTVAALFGADSLRTPEEGGENPLATLLDKSTKHAVGVSSELRDGLRLSVELIANESWTGCARPASARRRSRNSPSWAAG